MASYRAHRAKIKYMFVRTRNAKIARAKLFRAHLLTERNAKDGYRKGVQHTLKQETPKKHNKSEVFAVNQYKDLLDRTENMTRDNPGMFTFENGGHHFEISGKTHGGTCKIVFYHPHADSDCIAMLSFKLKGKEDLSYARKGNKTNASVLFFKSEIGKVTFDPLFKRANTIFTRYFRSSKLMRYQKSFFRYIKQIIKEIKNQEDYPDKYINGYFNS